MRLIINRTTGECTVVKPPTADDVKRYNDALCREVERVVKERLREMQPNEKRLEE